MDKDQAHAGYSKKERRREAEMTTNEVPQSDDRRVPSEAERRIAARIRVTADRARRVETPEWIKELAKAS